MVMAIAYDEAKAGQITINRGGRIICTPFFGSRGETAPVLDSPNASLNENNPGRYSPVHFHLNDQFQVVVDGRGTIGRHKLTRYSVHFARAYTPYGPLVADANVPLTFFVMRARHDPGAQVLSEKQDLLKQVPDRQPWQITRTATFPDPLSAGETADVLLELIPGMEDGHGLAAYTLSVKPNAKASAPDPAHGNGQYILALRGGLLHGHKEYQAPALLFIRPEEGPCAMQAGPAGLDALVLNFPRSGKSGQGHSKNTPTAAGHHKWQCRLCAFSYDEAQGMPEEGIVAGTPWRDVPDTWICPDCSAHKSDFEMTEG